MLHDQLLALVQTGQWSLYVSALRVAHHIPGRIRLKLSAGHSLDDSGLKLLGAYADLLVKVLGRVAGIRSVRLNPLARSCVLEYDPQVLSYEGWTDLLAGRNSAGAMTLQLHLYAGYQEVVDAKL